MTVRYDVVGGVATITLASPESRNVLSPDSMRALVEHFSTAANDDAVRVVILTGEGNTFCAGADLAGASNADAEGFAAAGPRALVAVLETIIRRTILEAAS